MISSNKRAGRELETKLENAKQSRKTKRAAHLDKQIEDPDFSIENFRHIWNAANENYPGVYGDHLDQKRHAEKLVALVASIGGETPGPQIKEFVEWLAAEWRTLRDRRATGWMHTKGMLPKHPDMRYVLHHWHHFFSAWIDRDREKSYDYEDPEVKLWRDRYQQLLYELREKAFFSDEASVARLKEEKAILQTRIDRLTATCNSLLAKYQPEGTPDLPAWEELQHDDDD